MRTAKVCWIILLALVLLSQAFIPLVRGHGGSDHDEDSAAEMDGEKPDLRAKGLILTKVWCLIIVFFATFFGGVSPYYLRWDEAFLVLGTQFAGGVFLATALIHFLGDANETFKDHTTNAYPFAFMLATAGYLLTMLGDVVIQGVYGRGDGQQQKAVEPDVERSSKDGGPTLTHQGLADVALVKQSSVGDAVLLILALCFHSVFEGIAIGVAGTKADAWRALWTVSLHKIFAAIAMGIALLRILPERPLLSCASYAFAFAISTPIGVAIGIIIDSTTQGSTADWIYAISMGLACGVFIYVAVNHLLAKGYVPREKVRVNTPFFRFLAVTFGCALIAVVLIWD
eukprot:TRINITY_DN23133_c0_g1_i1.p1 TRINITY_DN23133_c0_g1~~TRINITY_DN23133_c0_g1_i1.p1  ORF type:complete len:342 (+),score=41.93 TRINITY_DN23133_c0_g1_i1:391-1416(+)